MTLVADVFMFAGLVMLRFLVMFFPAVAVLGVMSPMSAIVRRVANMAGASVVNVVSFAVHTTVISALLNQADTPGMGLLALVLCLMTTVVAFILLFPLLSLTNIVGLSSGQRGMHAVRRAGRLAGRYAVTRKAVSDGEDDAQGDGDEPASGSSSTIQVASIRQQGRRVRVGAGPAESFGRPDPSGLRRVPLGIGAPSVARTTPTAGGDRAPIVVQSGARRTVETDGELREPMYPLPRTSISVRAATPPQTRRPPRPTYATRGRLRSAPRTRRSRMNPSSEASSSTRTPGRQRRGPACTTARPRSAPTASGHASSIPPRRRTSG